MPDYVPAPSTAEEADKLIQALVSNQNQLAQPLRESIRHWDSRGAGLFAHAAKKSFHYQHGHMLGTTLRSLSNTAIIIQHRRAQSSSPFA